MSNKKKTKKEKKKNEAKEKNREKKNRQKIQTIKKRKKMKEKQRDRVLFAKNILFPSFLILFILNYQTKHKQLSKLLYFSFIKR